MSHNNPQELEYEGWTAIEDAVDDSAIVELSNHFQTSDNSNANRHRNGKTFGIRNLLRNLAIIRQLAKSPAIRSLIEPVLGEDAIAVRGILFDKTPDANWTVPWHQDLSIAVMQKHQMPGFGPWSVKAAVPHVQPPVHILQSMLTVRLHLDDCGENNGPLLVIPGSHAHGVLSPSAVEEYRKSARSVACTVNRGGAVLMRPLLLHASHSAASPAHRRVVHLEYAAGNLLPDPLRWFIA